MLGRDSLPWGWWGTETCYPDKLWILESVQGQVEWGFEQPVLVECVDAHGRRVETRWPSETLLILTIPCFCVL